MGSDEKLSDEVLMKLLDAGEAIDKCLSSHIHQSITVDMLEQMKNEIIRALNDFDPTVDARLTLTTVEDKIEIFPGNQATLDLIRMIYRNSRRTGGGK